MTILTATYQPLWVCSSAQWRQREKVDQNHSLGGCEEWVQSALQQGKGHSVQNSGHCCVYHQECHCDHHFLETTTEWETKSYCLESYCASRLQTLQAEEINNEDKEETRRIQFCGSERLRGSAKVRMGCVHGAGDILTLYCPSYSLQNMLSGRVVNWNTIRPRKGWGLRYTTFHT